MINEIAEIAHKLSPDSIIVDATFGGGGHSSVLASILNEKGIFIGLDRDPYILGRYGQKTNTAKCEVFLKNSEFSKLDEILEEMGIFNIDFILADLGVSSFQLDESNRGFSFSKEGPLDMRMGNTGETLLEKLQKSEFSELKTIIKKYGEEPSAHKIALEILKAVQNNSLKTTTDLSNLISKTVRKPKNGKHPATKTFQALRIWVNDELGEIEQFMLKAPKYLAPKGILAIITFHSLEDRIVKQRFKNLAHPEKLLHPDLPLTKEQMPKAYFKETGPIIPTKTEIQKNPRARSAKLRILQRIV